jgi:hypothetical protein
MAEASDEQEIRKAFKSRYDGWDMVVNAEDTIEQIVSKRIAVCGDATFSRNYVKQATKFGG